MQGGDGAEHVNGHRIQHHRRNAMTLAVVDQTNHGLGPEPRRPTGKDRYRGGSQPGLIQQGTKTTGSATDNTPGGMDAKAEPCSSVVPNGKAGANGEPGPVFDPHNPKVTQSRPATDRDRLPDPAVADPFSVTARPFSANYRC